MSPAPDVSVVMGVRDGGPALDGSIASVLNQRGVEFELIVVDDGSTDDTAARVAACAARDGRVRLLRQGPAGLTTALVRGCAEARAPLVARHDAGDRSHPERLRLQTEALARHPEAVLVSCWTVCLGPGDELLFVERGRHAAERPVNVLEGDPPVVVAGPTSHGSALFRADAYRRVGGYRVEFALGQDWDLWQRLGLVGRYVQVPRALYARTFSPSSLTFALHDLQVELGRLSLAACRARHARRDESPILAAAARLSATVPARRASRRAQGEARGLYHVGELLRRAGDARCADYFRAAVRRRPQLVRAWVRLSQALATRRSASAPAPPEELAWACARGASLGTGSS